MEIPQTIRELDNLSALDCLQIVERIIHGSDIEHALILEDNKVQIDMGEMMRRVLKAHNRKPLPVSEYTSVEIYLGLVHLAHGPNPTEWELEAAVERVWKEKDLKDWTIVSFAPVIKLGQYYAIVRAKRMKERTDD